MAEFVFKQCIATKNDCYRQAKKMAPKGIVVHSTGANNPYIKRYVQPDDGILGKNQYNNDWNRTNVLKCMHAFIGLTENKYVECYQTLPFDYCCWGVGSGSKGSYNYNPAYIQFEICEDDLTNTNYFNAVFDKAINFCVYLCKTYNIPIKNVISHQEAFKQGYGSNHIDPEHWLKKYGKNMDWFRNEVETRLNEKPVEPIKPETPELPKEVESFKLGDVVEPTTLIDYDGTKLKQYDDQYTITQIKGDRAVLSAPRKGKMVIWSAMNIKDIKKV